MGGQFEGHGIVPRLDVKTLETHGFRHFPDMPLLFVIPELSIIAAFEVAVFHWTLVNAPPPPVCLHVRIVLLLILEHLAAAFAEPPRILVVVLKVFSHPLPRPKRDFTPMAGISFDYSTQLARILTDLIKVE